MNSHSTKPDYDDSYYQGNQQDRDRPALVLYQRLVRRYLPAGPIVDFGCGMGHLLKRLSRDRVTAGVEASEWAAIASQRNSPSSTIYRSLEEVPSASHSGIVSIHVIEHINDEGLRPVLEQFKRIVRPGGRVLLVTPDATGWAAQNKGKDWNALTDPTHINLKGHASWRKVFENHGFGVLKEAADGLYDFPYPPRKSKLIDVGMRGWPTAFQFVAGRMILKPGCGESVIFLLGIS